MNSLRIKRRILESLNKIATDEDVKITISGIFPTLSINIDGGDNYDRDIRHSNKYKFTQNIVGMEFTWNTSSMTSSLTRRRRSRKNIPIGTKMKVIGFEPKRRKYTISCQCMDGIKSGSIFCVTKECVKEMLGGDVGINRKFNLVSILKT